jgi:hypothetical protein
MRTLLISDPVCIYRGSMNVEEELLDSYLAALGAFYDARKLSLTRWLLRDSGAREATEARLLEVRHKYWSYIEASHSRSQTQHPANSLTAGRSRFHGERALV